MASTQIGTVEAKMEKCYDFKGADKASGRWMERLGRKQGTGQLLGFWLKARQRDLGEPCWGEGPAELGGVQLSDLGC